MKKTKEAMKQEMENTIKMYEAKIKLWQNVARKTKKDGSDFQNFSKNFENAEIIVKYGDQYIQVSDYSQRIGGEFVVDDFRTRQIVKYFKNWEIPQDRIVKVPYLEPYFDMTPDEIMEYIKVVIDKYKTWIAEYQDQIKKLDVVYDHVDNVLSDLMDYVRKNTGNNTHLYYEMRKFIQNVGY